jgi:peptide/nickel transport system permease protein
LRNYIWRRVIQAMPLLLGITIVTFLLLQAMPGGPLAIYASNPRVRPEDLARLRLNLGLDLPWYNQYLRWLTTLATGNWGYSFNTGQPVLTLITRRLPATLQLMTIAFIISVAIGLPLGVLAAVRRYSWLDYSLSVFAFAGVSLPVFWLGLMLMLVFSVHLRWLPSSGMQSIGGPDSLVDRTLHLILPVTVLSLARTATWSRYLRSSLLEVIRQDYIVTARAKGLREKVVIYRHALKNSLLPVLTVMGMEIPQFCTGAVITETIFAWPGMGRLFYEAVLGRDFTLLMGILTLSAALVVIGNLLTDVAYAYFDPRIRFD